MTGRLDPAATLESIRRNLVGLKMARALEVLDQTLRQIEQGQIGAVEAIDVLLTEELTLRQTRRVKMALMTARITTVKTLASFDFAFQSCVRLKGYRMYDTAVNTVHAKRARLDSISYV